VDEARDVIHYGINPRDEGVSRLDLAALFGNGHPLAVEIGSGKGRFLLDSTRTRPDWNFLGVEKSLHYYRVIVRRIEHAKLPNVRIINYDAFAVLKEMLPPASVDELHIYFPDPWPRKREQKRRIIRDEVCVEIARVLSDGGWGVYVTDHRDYFERAAEVLASYFLIEAGEVKERPPRTNYEAKYRAEGRPIFEVSFWRRN
jgi:tRNA (guanine-N7-)-methyltransferase